MFLLFLWCKNRATLFLGVDAQRFSYPPHLAEVNGAMGATLLE
jgi:hypothetical protein